MNTNKGYCYFECENLKDNGCAYEDETVKCACNFCELALDCDRCRHKANCKKRKTQ